MTRLTVLYDPKCGLCAASADWLRRQPQLVQLDLLPGGQNEAISRFPQIYSSDMAGDLVVVADSGEIWRGPNAWIMTLWALDDYRDLAERLSRPILAPLARRIFENLSTNRHALAGLFGLEPKVCPGDPA